MTLNSFSATWRLDVIQFTKDASNLSTGTIPDARISDTLTADKAYRRGNILGTVSQSGGTPTGALIEYDSNANGEYVRFADGLQICTSPAFSLDTNEAIGNMFRTGSTTTWTYPAAFSATPSANSHASTVTRWANAQPKSTTECDVRSYSATQSAVATDVYLVAIGRWF